ncbi:hypothetical protein [Roseateles oligotrophus]|uniref:Uncharacterized protein n=1 Tax=Roseateles oligotrophus TaxID=1769250 RepID=A0ABT2YJ12_9BURK|nr:hypothetical protein [Roseateles oligotrophus]MCV2370052.1 hypothetical protein [Roseateles oligotrophus]
MPLLRNYLTAVLVGAMLAWLVVMAMGVLAAIPISPAFLAAQRNSPVLVHVLTTTLLVQVPGILLSSLVGWSFFRLTRRATIGLVAVIAFPWIGLVLLWSWPLISSADLAVIEKLGNLLSWRAAPGTLSIPLGLAAAYMAVGFR